jgi:4-amino-4-deoxy-L-arabinose transferase-like glycosyltransferase
VWVESEEGKGSRFRIYFPAAEIKTETHPLCRTEPGSRVRSGTETLLFVEDEPAIRAPASEFLEQCGHRVLIAANGREAQAVLAESNLPVDLVVTDVVMPETGGGGLAEFICGTFPRTRILFMSEYAGRIDNAPYPPRPFIIQEASTPMDPSAGQSTETELRPTIASRFDMRSWIASLGILTGLWLVIYVATMFTPPLLDDVDTIHAEAAREMLQRHDWVTLYTNGLRYLEKAPLMYWSLASSYTVFGISDWSTRLPLMLGVLALVLATYALGRYAYGERSGFYSGLALVTSVGPYIFTRFLIPDVLVGLWLTLGYYLFLRSLEEDPPSRSTCWGFAAICALNVLTKGLIGLVFPAAAIGLYLLITGNLRHLLRLRLVSSTLVFFLIAAPWHILAALRNPPQGDARGFLWFYFINEHVMRFLNKRVPPGYDTVPLLLFWLLLFVWLVPWVVFFPQSLRAVPWRPRRWRSQLSRCQRASLLFFLWAFVILAFFSFSTRQEYYTIPALPAIALLTGWWLGREAAPDASTRDRKAGRNSATALLVIGILAFVVGMVFFGASQTPAPGVDLADLLRKNPQDYDFSLGHMLDLTPLALGIFRGPLLGASLSLLLGPLLNWWMRRRERPASGNAALAGMMVALLWCVHVSFARFSPILSSYDLAMAVQEHYRPGDLIVIDGQYHEASTLNFYTRTPVRILHEPSGNLWFGSKFPDAPHVFETTASLAGLWQGPAAIFVWTNQDDPKELAGLPHFLLARRGGKSIFTNRPLTHP